MRKALEKVGARAKCPFSEDGKSRREGADCQILFQKSQHSKNFLEAVGKVELISCEGKVEIEAF